MVGALSPVDVGYGAKTRYRRSAHGTRFCAGCENCETVGPADCVDGLRYSRRWPKYMEQLESGPDPRALSSDPSGARGWDGGRDPRIPRGRGTGCPETGIGRLARHGPENRNGSPLRPLLAGAACK